jgi:hydroxyacylglutathione hydrolase
MYVQQFFIDGLGCASYLVGCELNGVAAVVDPDRDVRKYLQAAEARRLKITHIIETHLHADHVSGNTDLAARTGAGIYIHAAAGAAFKHEALNEGDLLEIGSVQIAVRHTPGHTPESITLLVRDTARSQEPTMALTGDLLFVGDVGRPDLTGQGAARSLAGDLYESLYHRLLSMSDDLIIYPGHGAGSLCGRAIGSARSTTLGSERRNNPALAIAEKEDFIEYMTSNLPEQPGNHQYIKRLNRQGPQSIGEVHPQPLSTKESIPHFQRGAAMLDTRSKAAYIEKHVPGSVHLEADDQLSNKIGFVFPPQQPVVLLLSSPQDYESIVYSLARVGYEAVLGYLSEGIDGWEAAGLPVTSGDIQDISAAELSDLIQREDETQPVIVDVREPWEFVSGHIPGALLIPLGELAGRIAELDTSRPTAVVCASGNRSQSAAALLGQQGFQKVYNLADGMHGWQMAGFKISRNGKTH